MDLELDKLRLDEDSVPAALRGARDERDRLSAGLERLRAEHAGVRKALSTADLELKDLSAKRDRAKHDQAHAGSAKEQSQFESVILQLGARIEELENDALPLVDRLEDLGGQVKALEAEFAVLEPQLKELEGLDEDRVRALRAEYDDKLFKRNTLAEDVDERLLREYDSVRRAKKGVGFVRIAAGKCGACKAQLPVNIVQRIKGGQWPVKCPSCGRILAPAA
jgi:predicted  nucleic acid-binding Zn-ribbon protein